MARPKKKERRYRIAESQTGGTDGRKSNTTYRGKALFVIGSWNRGSTEQGTIMSPAGSQGGLHSKGDAEMAMTS